MFIQGNYFAVTQCAIQFANAQPVANRKCLHLAQVSKPIAPNARDTIGVTLIRIKQQQVYCTFS
ncbi:MAG: hypothetical protein ACOY9J_11300 [Pseudomonadota bacterium]